MIVRKLGPPLLAGEAAFCGEDFPSVVFPHSHDALSNVDFTTYTQSVQQLRSRHVELIFVTSHT